MRSKMILVAFLLMLYIGPSLFAVSIATPGIPTEPNMVKDFAIAEDWYNESWHWRKIVEITGVWGGGTDWQVRIPVTYDSNMQIDFDDIRFTDDNKTLLLDHWRESYNESTSAIFWVKVTEEFDFGGPEYIYMYWGDSEVSDVSDGNATFLMYEDWTTESVRAAVWNIVTADGGVTYDAGGASHGTIAKFQADDGDAYRITSDYNTASPIAVMFRSNLEEASAGNTARQGSGYDGAFAFNLVQSADAGEKFYVFDDDGNEDSQAMNVAYFDDWITFQITRDGTNSKLYADDALIATASCAPDIIATNPATSIMVGDDEDDLYSDWVAVRKFDINIAFDSFGEEENNFPPPEWEEAGVAIVVFAVAVDMVAFDMFFIILGLALIPVSTVFLVKGGKSDMSTDKLFFFLILFFMGWGLFLGGIYG